jgi:hypothetical protein
MADFLTYFSNTFLDFRFTIMTAESTDYLQTSHYPPLNWNDHKEIDCIFKVFSFLKTIEYFKLEIFIKKN